MAGKKDNKKSEFDAMVKSLGLSKKEIAEILGLTYKGKHLAKGGAVTKKKAAPRKAAAKKKK